MPYLLSRKLGLKFILRIDDTDRERSKEEFIDAAKSDLKWLGINWDYSFRQSEKTARYQEMLQKCIDAGIVYKVYDAEDDLEALRDQLKSMRRAPSYKRSHAKEVDRPHYWRFDIGSEDIKFVDEIKGEIQINLATVSDPVICKPNGEFTYTFASIVDDICEGVSHIIRGADHVTNTAVQMKMLNEMIKHNICSPREISFAHYPLFSDRSGGKFSKRNLAFAIKEMRHDFHPLSLVHYLTLLGSNEKRHPCYSIEELASHFDLKNYASSTMIEFDEAEIYNWQRLIFSGATYDFVKEYLADSSIDEKMWSVLRESITTREDVDAWGDIMHKKCDYTTCIRGFYDSEVKVQSKESILPYLKEAIRKIVKKNKGFNKDSGMIFLRQILTGRNSGPKISDLLRIMPDETFVYRLSNYHCIGIFLYNTLIRTLDEFSPIDYRKVRVYACGPTVYAPPHIGNARSFVVFDVLIRLLRHFYNNVIYVRNVTDIDDKIIAASAARGISYKKLTDEVYKQFSKDMEMLNVAKPTFEPRATEYMDEILEAIKSIIESGAGYVSEDGVYFDISKVKHYDVFSCLSGEHSESDNFALWKFRPESEIGWDSPWGYGRPGWHIECSAMSASLLDLPFDIHCGGKDLIFPHHTNECAQAAAMKHSYTAKYWLHNHFVNSDETKMSKSLGNFLTLSDIDTHPMIVRTALLMTHYRGDLTWSDSLLQEATSLYNKWRRSLGKYGNKARNGYPLPGLLWSVANDLNTPQAIREVDWATASVNESNVSDVIASFDILGITFDFEYLQNKAVAELVQKRQIARQNRDFTTADRIRDELNSMGIELEDNANGSAWYEKLV